jgi:oxygen-independent coproporphyrinogen III oxidase
MTTELPAKFARPVPRYTSYPTAPHFSAEIDHVRYAGWLAELPATSRLSLYVHIPFCHRLCWYCGCNTKATRRYDPVARYLEAVYAEIARLATLVPAHRVTHMHWGGGSPNILSAGDVVKLADALRAHFSIEADAEFSVEMDPRYLDADAIAAFGWAGLSRLSLGVQDLDEVVQAAIGREQSFESTRRAVEAFREQGVRSINIDLMYGLPHQTPDTVERTAARVLELAPDRLAIFGYAHLPQRIKHQRLIPAAHLPSVGERLAQLDRLGQFLVERGYVRVGLDHYAKPTDPLASGAIARNFQGYTTDRADALLGIGASAIGRLPQGYVQNAVAASDYASRIRQTGLATAKGIELTGEDRVRGYVIERLMCDLEFSATDVRRVFGAAADPVLHEVDALLAEHDSAHLVQRTADGFIVTEAGRPFVRSICAEFDAYLGTGKALHAASA